MGFDEIVALLVNNGIGVACIAYFMFRDYHFMQKLSDAISSLNATLDEFKSERELQERIEKERENERKTK